MKGDKRNYLPIHYIKADIILKEIMKHYKNDNKMILAVGGMAGTGKTEITDIIQVILCDKFNIRAKNIHLDDYYKIHYERRNEWRKQRGIKAIGTEEIKWGKVKSIIKQFRKGKALKLQQIHRFINAIEYSKVSSRNINILIIEGLYANYLKKLGTSDLGIYLEGTVKQTHKFRLERAKEKTNNSFRQKILEKEFLATEETKEYADLCIKYNVDN